MKDLHIPRFAQTAADKELVEAQKRAMASKQEEQNASRMVVAMPNAKRPGTKKVQLANTESQDKRNNVTLQGVLDNQAMLTSLLMRQASRYNSSNASLLSASSAPLNLSRLLADLQSQAQQQQRAKASVRASPAALLSQAQAALTKSAQPVQKKRKRRTLPHRSFVQQNISLPFPRLRDAPSQHTLTLSFCHLVMRSEQASVTNKPMTLSVTGTIKKQAVEFSIPVKVSEGKVTRRSNLSFDLECAWFKDREVLLTVNADTREGALAIQPYPIQLKNTLPPDQIAKPGFLSYIETQGSQCRAGQRYALLRRNSPYLLSFPASMENIRATLHIHGGNAVLKARRQIYLPCTPVRNPFIPAPGAASASAVTATQAASSAAPSPNPVGSRVAAKQEPESEDSAALAPEDMAAATLASVASSLLPRMPMRSH